MAALEAHPSDDPSSISFAELEPSYAAEEGQTRDALLAIAAGWWVVAGMIFVAGLVLAWQVVQTTTHATNHERSVLQAIGATRGELATATMLVVAPAMVVGTAIGVAVSILASPLASVGLARSIEPYPGSIVVSGGVIAGGGVTMVIVALTIAVLAVGSAGARRSARYMRPAPWPRLVRPIAAVLGAREALGRRVRDSGRTSVLVAALAIAGMVAAIAVAASIAYLGDDPTLTGSTPARVLDSGESTDLLDEALPFVTSDPRVGFAATYHIFFPNFADGTETTAIAIDVLRGDFAPTILHGEPPIHPDEAVLGPATLEVMNVDVGDTVQLMGDTGEPVDFEVVGSGLFPQGDFDFDAGVGLTAAGATRVIGDPHDNAAIHGLIFDWSPDVDAAAADASVGIDPFTDAESLAPPPVTNLAQVTGLVRLLAAVFAIMALAVLTHAALIAERKRRHDIAAVRALGLGHGAGPLSVVAHAFAVLAMSVMVGVPLGALVARTVWTRIAADAHFVPVTRLVPGQQLAAVACLALAASITLALPLLRSRQLRPITELRAE
jgi:hypothetical protein